MRNNPYLIKIIIPVFALLLSSCFVDNCCPDDEDNSNKRKVVGEGELVEHELSLATFHDISNTGVMQLTVTQGEKQKVTISAQENIFRELTFEVVKGKLQISSKKDVSISTNLGLFGELVMTEDPQNIEIVGTGDVTLTADKQSSLNITILGTGNVKAFGLEVDKCVINSTGTGFCEVMVNELLDVTITGIGNVYYKGNPSISKQIVGLGSIVDKN